MSENVYDAWNKHVTGECGDDPERCEYCYHDTHEHADFVYGTVCIVDMS